MSKYGTPHARTARNAIIHPTLLVASSGLTRANRVHRTGRLGAELDAALRQAGYAYRKAGQGISLLFGLS